MIESGEIGHLFLLGFALTSLIAMPVFILGMVWSLRHMI